MSLRRGGEREEEERRGERDEGRRIREESSLLSSRGSQLSLSPRQGCLPLDVLVR